MDKKSGLSEQPKSYATQSHLIMENLGYREGTTKLSKHRRMSRAASLAVDTEGIPLSARCVDHCLAPKNTHAVHV